MMVNCKPVGQRGKHAGISTDIAIKVKDDVGHKIWGALPIIVRVMYRVGSLFDKSAQLIFVDKFR